MARVPGRWRPTLIAADEVEEKVIRHVVFFKFKPGVSDSDRRAALAELAELPKKIELIRDFELGEDLVCSPRSWDAVLVATYDDLEALDRYQGHAAHVPVAGLLRSLCESIGSVDYEI